MPEPRALLGQVILYAQDVDRLAAFYADRLGLAVVEAIPEEWVVLRAGACNLALHRIGPAWREMAGPRPGEGNNVKLVLTVEGDLAALREALLAEGVAMREMKAFSDGGPLCDGEDPEGNVFQLMQRAGPSPP